jgi:hypothetical protein
MGLAHTSPNEGNFLVSWNNEKVPFCLSQWFKKDKECNSFLNAGLKLAYNENFELKKGNEIKIKWMGVDDESVPERYWKGKKSIYVDGDRFEYEHFFKCKIVSEAYEFLFDAENYFKRFKVLGEGSTKWENRYRVASEKTLDQQFPVSLALIFILANAVVFGYFSFFNPD